MNKVLLLSFDIMTTPTITLLPSYKEGEKKTSDYGWGVAWYPNDGNSNLIIKEATSHLQGSFMDSILGWKLFFSSTFLYNIQDIQTAFTQDDLSPYSRTYAGKQWVWSSMTKELTEELRKSLEKGEGLFEPLGHAPAQLSFCWFMRKVHSESYRSLSEAPLEAINRWCHELDDLSPTNIVITDSLSTIVYKSQYLSDSLYILRKTPPYENMKLCSDYIHVDFQEAHNPQATMVAVSSEILSDDPWIELVKGKCFMVTKGAIIWEAESDQAEQVLLSDSEKNKFQQLSQIAKPAPIQTVHDFTYKETLTQETPQARTLKIVHETQYLYEDPVRNSFHLLRLHPIHDRYQRLKEFEVTISVESKLVQYVDVFGNDSIMFTIEEPYRELTIRSESVVNLLPLPIDDFRSSIKRSAIPLTWLPWQSQMMLPYMIPVELPASQLIELNDYAMSFVKRNSYELLATIMDMNLTIYRDYKYKSGSTTLSTTPFDTYMNRVGVCQDFANLLICLARLLNIPARYRVGYIYTGTKYENTEQSEASHAWVEVYLPNVGWRGFDPTNGTIVTQDHIRVACGRNYLDATPTSGTIYLGGSGEKLDARVQVTEI